MINDLDIMHGACLRSSSSFKAFNGKQLLCSLAISWLSYNHGREYLMGGKKIIIIIKKDRYYLCLVGSMWVRSGRPVMTHGSKRIDPTQPTTGAGP